MPRHRVHLSPVGSGLRRRLFEDADAMILAVADVEPRALDEHAVRPRHLARPRIAVGAVAALSRADDRADRARLEIDGADHVILGVRRCRACCRRGRCPFGPFSGEPGAPNFAASAGPPSPS